MRNFAALMIAGTLTVASASSANVSDGALQDDTSFVPATALVEDASDTSLAQMAASKRVESFEVRGLRLGMSPREVGRIAGKNGFRRRWNDGILFTGSFDLEAARAANYKLDRPISKTSRSYLRSTQGVDHDGSELKLEFILWPTGPRLSRIEYRAKLDGTTKEQFLSALRAKYGQWDDAGLTYKWNNGATTPGERNSNAEMHVILGSNAATFFLESAVNDSLAAKKKLADRAQQLAGSKGNGIRF